MSFQQYCSLRICCCSLEPQSSKQYISLYCIIRNHHKTSYVLPLTFQRHLFKVDQKKQSCLCFNSIGTTGSQGQFWLDHGICHTNALYYIGILYMHYIIILNLFYCIFCYTSFNTEHFNILSLIIKQKINTVNCYDNRCLD